MKVSSHHFYKRFVFTAIWSLFILSLSRVTATSQPIKVHFTKTRLVTHFTKAKNWEYSVTVNDHALSSGSWMVLPERYVHFKISIKYKKDDSLYKTKSYTVWAEDLDKAGSNLTIPVNINYESPDGSDKKVFRWEFTFQINT